MNRTAVGLAVVAILLCTVLPASRALPANLWQQVVIQGQPKPQRFGGRVVSQNQVRLVLKDYEDDVWYHIDDQQRAATFLGKDVLITGVFDGLTGTIRLQNIVEATPEQISAANTERIKENTPSTPKGRSAPSCGRCESPGDRSSADESAPNAGSTACRGSKHSPGQRDPAPRAAD